MPKPTDPAERDTPSNIRKELKRYGGDNPYGEANWRVVLAQNHLVIRGGIFHEMPDGNVNQIEIDPKTYRMHVNEVKPDSIRTGYLKVPKYPCKGWVLERWFPSEKWSKETWESAKSSDGLTPMMGPFPSRGDYFMLAGPWERIPPLSDLREAIALHLREENNAPVNYQVFMQAAVDREHDRETKRLTQYRDFLAHFYAHEVAPVLKGTSLGAQRIRNELQTGMGEQSHLGVA